jgi:segregation and condensation protein B
MVPPRLTVVSRNDRINDNAPSDDNPAAAEARELARAIAEVESSRASGAGVASDRVEKLRILEAILFAASEPLDQRQLASHLGADDNVSELLDELRALYAGRGVNLVRIADSKWAFRTAGDLSYLLERFAVEERRLSKAALETLAIVAYHQPVTRAEIEDIRGVTTSAGTLDILMEAGWIRPRGRRRAPGKPITYGTTDSFLSHFGLETVKDLPGLSDLRAAGLLDATLPPGFTIPDPSLAAGLMPDELPLDAGDDEEEDGQAEMELGLPEADDEPNPDRSGA